MNQREVDSSVLLHVSRSASHVLLWENQKFITFVLPHMPACKNINRDQFVLHRMRSSDSFTQLWLEKRSLLWAAKLSRLSCPSDGCAWKADSPPTKLVVPLIYSLGNVSLHVCAFQIEKKKGPKAIRKSSSMVPPHVLCTSTTCCWSTVGNKRLPKSLVTSLQYPFLAACLCLNTNMPTHN